MANEDVKLAEDICNMFDFTKQEFEDLKDKLMLNEELSKILEMKNEEIKGIFNKIANDEHDHYLMIKEYISNYLKTEE